MFRTTARSTVAAALATLAFASSAHAITSFFDGIFNNADWNLTVITNASGAGSSSVGFQVLTGGNPNEYRRIRNNGVVSTAGNGTVIGLHMNNLAFYTPSSSGAITSIAYSEDSINFLPSLPGNGQGTGLAIMQNGKNYVLRTPTLVMPGSGFATWAPNSAPFIVASDMWEITGAGIFNSSSNPDFTASGTIMQLGFWRGNSANSNFSTDCGIDNWHVNIAPSPGSLALLGLGGLAAARRRR